MSVRALDPQAPQAIRCSRDSTSGESLALFRNLGRHRQIGQSLMNLGLLSLVQSDYRAARRYFEDCLPLFQAVGD